MKLNAILMTTLVLGAAACTQSQPENNSSNSLLAANEATPIPNPPPPAPHPSAPSAAAPGTSDSLPDDRAPLPEPKGPIDPKSAEAAGQVVQHYGALIEQGRWTESWKLWSNPAAAKQFDRNWRNDSEVHMEVGKPADMEGAAGSIYISVPVVFYGKSKAGDSFRRPATAILRRVNDVPGSTEAQRHWHIERIDLKAAA